MRSVRTFLLYSLVVTVVSSVPSHYQARHGGRTRTKVIVVREPEREYEVRHVLRRKHRPRQVVVTTEECLNCGGYYQDDHYGGHQGSVSVVREVAQPDLVVVDHGGAGYLQPQPAITHTHPVAALAPVAPVATVAAVAPVATVAAAPVSSVYPTSRPSAVDP